MRIFIRPQATPPIDIEGCGLRDQRCCNVHPASFNQLAKETRYSRGSFARNSSRQKTPTTESPPSVKQSRTTSNPERCSFVAFEPPKVSLPVDLHFLPHASNAPSLVSRLTLRLSMSIDNRTSNQTLALKRKKMFIARVEWLPVTSRSHVTDGHHRQTNVRLVYTRSELASLAPSFRGHNFVQNTRAIIYNDCAHVRACAYSFVLKPHPQSILRGVVCETNVAATCILLRSIS